MNPKDLTTRERVKARKLLRFLNQKCDRRLQPCSVEQLRGRRGAPFAAWRSRDYIVQAFDDGGFTRLSVNRSDFDIKTGDWIAGITWDELQRIKAECGFADRWAVEVFPPDDCVVNVANMRHLWLIDKPAFGWNLNPDPGDIAFTPPGCPEVFRGRNFGTGETRVTLQ